MDQEPDSRKQARTTTVGAQDSSSSGFGRQKDNAEALNLGYLKSLVLFSAAIAVVAIAHYRFQMNAVLSFWLAYILTRSLGASIGDDLSQPKDDGGLGLGTTVMSVIFLAAILTLVIYLSVAKRDVIEPEPDLAAA